MLFIHTSNRGIYIFFAECNNDAIKHIREDLNTEQIKLTKIHTEMLYQLISPIGFKITFILEADVTSKED